MMEEILWEWVTASKIVESGPCFLVGVDLSPSGNAATSSVYDGQDASGKLIDTLVRATKDNLDLMLPGKIRCQSGIFISVGANTTGVLVLWQKITGKGET